MSVYRFNYLRIYWWELDIANIYFPFKMADTLDKFWFIYIKYLLCFEGFAIFVFLVIVVYFFTFKFLHYTYICLTIIYSNVTSNSR